jgi:hypothetical protein
MRNIIILSLLCLFFSSCDKKDCCGIQRDTILEFEIINGEGKDLLNSETPGFYNKDNIEVYYLINGIKEKVFYPNLDNPKQFLVYTVGNKYVLRLFPNENKSNNSSITYLELNKSDTDTVKCIYAINSLVVEEVYYNDSLVFNGSGARSFVVKK